MKEEETIKKYSDRIMAVVNSIRLLGEQFDEARIVEKVLSTLSERYEAKISSLEDSRDLTSMFLTELINALYAQEQRRASRSEEHQEGAFQAKAKTASSTSAYKGKKNWRNRPKPDAARGEDRFCRFCKKLIYLKARCWFRLDAVCQHCKKKGHVEKVCKEKGRPRQNQQQLRAEAQIAEDGSDNKEQAFTVSCSAAQKKVSNGWLLDSGCTNHMSLDATIFKSLDRSCKTKVKVSNGHFIKAEGKGDVVICTPTVAMTEKSFVMDWNKGFDNAYVVSSEDSKLWHQRLGHANFRSMTQMISEDLVENFTNSVEEEETESLNGSRYFILFIDDYSRYCWAYFHRSKYEVLSIFQKFKAAAETEIGCKLKTVRSDNGTEYTSSGFNIFCDEAGIRHQLTNTYTPQQNGVSERKNRSLINMARCLLFEKNLPKTMWAEAVNTVVYIQNRLPTKALAQKTPFEAWFGFKPSLAHMKVFGCLCYSQIPAVKRDKLSKRAIPGILARYSMVKKGYRILDPLTNKIHVSRDVIFDEKGCWNWEKNEPEAVSEKLMADHTEPNQVSLEMDVDDMPVRGTRPLAKIYERAQVAIVEPCSFEEAEADKGWKQAMVDEIAMIEKNQTWELVPRPAKRKVIGVKWVYRAKQNADGSLKKLKARLVVKGFSQKYGLDYLETFAPVAKLDTIGLLVALAAQKQWKIYQLDVKSAFLNGFLEEEIYIDQPQGFVVSGKEQMVYRLKKALYGLQQAPRAWYAQIDSYLISLGFNRSVNEPTLYVKKNEAEIQLIVSLYVDDLLVTGGDQDMLAEFKAKMMDMFEMSDLGLMTYFLGMEVRQIEGKIFLGQRTFALKVLSKFSMKNCKPTSTPIAVGMKLSSQGDHEPVNESTYRSLVGCLLYLTATRPDILFTVSMLSRFMHCCNVQHFQAAKRVLRYIKGTLNYGVLFNKAETLKLKSYTDSDWAGSSDDMKSTSGYAFTLGSTMFCWSSRKQSMVAQSTAEAEYAAAANAVNQAIWLRKILADLNLHQREATEIFCDNKSAVAIAKNPVFHEEQVADIFTKALGVSRFVKLRKQLGVTSMETKEEC
ncbi:hypothetical protein CXB51_029021 [Gossypium anomalum]|uniref:Integrase catalytic domain-containing protein n=1 Tax=Gossypium anomalum TaxID=47600 RepID=A0A8J6CLA9_9ROSI|nr:hypothetical protein CXB51_029021 [Gossypium anomalum]